MIARNNFKRGKFMYCSKIRFIDIVIVTILFSCATIRAAVPGPEPRETKYIVYSYGARDYFPIVEKVAAALQLPSPSERASIFYVEHKKDFNEKIRASHNVNWVCVAHYDKCRPVAELTRSLHEGHRIDVDFHSILFFDSYPVERIAGTATEEVTKAVSNYTLDIRFEKILHRVYNFYSEESSAWYRKIYPADNVITTGLLPIANWTPERFSYLKGVNIKCFNITKDNALNNFNFSTNTGWTLGFPSYVPSRALVNAADKIGQVIRYIDSNYLINTDLTAVLTNESLVTDSDVIPNKTAPEPMVIINRPTHWDGSTLSQIIASEGWTSWLTWQAIGQKTEWNLKINNPADQNQVFIQLGAEANVNASRNAITPYFYPWIEYYRSLNLKSRTPGFEWFNQLATVTTAPHKRDIAHASGPLPGTTNYLCDAERAYLEARKPFIQGALGIAGNKFPKIAIVASGGGIRAMLATLGFLRGLERTNLLNAVTYVCGLSGSTWAIGPWISSEKTVEEYITPNRIIEKVANFEGPGAAFRTGIKQKFTVTEDNMVKTYFGQSWTFVDSWGLYISKNLLLDPNMQLSQQEPRIANGHNPLPIYTAVDTNARNRDWFEFTPFEIGSLKRKVYIPSWSFGRNFIFGTSQDFPPEQSLGYLLGIFGSAMGARFKDVTSGAGLTNLTAAEWSATAGIIPNFYFGIRNINGNTETEIHLVDAGADFNLPYPPISGINPERKADIIIFVDSSGEFGDEIGGEIRKTVDWQSKVNKAGNSTVQLPIEMTEWCTQKPRRTRDLRIRTFAGNARAGIPTVIYMPLALDLSNIPGFAYNETQQKLIADFKLANRDLLASYTNINLMEKYPTGNFSYTPQQSKFLLDLMTLNVQISIEKIMDEIRRYVATMPE